MITATTVDGGHTASYNLTVKAAAVDLIATYGAIDNIRLSTGSGTEKAAEGYVTVGHNAPIDVSKQTYPNGAIIRVTGAVNCNGGDWSTTPNGGDSAWSMYINAAKTYYVQFGTDSYSDRPKNLLNLSNGNLISSTSILMPKCALIYVDNNQSCYLINPVQAATST